MIARPRSIREAIRATERSISPTYLAGHHYHTSTMKQRRRTALSNFYRGGNNEESRDRNEVMALYTIEAKARLVVLHRLLGSYSK